MFELPSLTGMQEAVITADVMEGRARPLYTYSDKGQVQQSAPCFLSHFTSNACAQVNRA
jgi:hypothetical protein